MGVVSADAAAALRLLTRLWEIGSDAEDKTLLQIAAELGSDVPACLVSRTLMGTGRGVALEPRAMPDLSGTPLLLVNPRRGRSEEHTSELQSLMSHSYAVFCLK